MAPNSANWRTMSARSGAWQMCGGGAPTCGRPQPSQGSPPVSWLPACVQWCAAPLGGPPTLSQSVHSRFQTPPGCMGFGLDWLMEALLYLKFKAAGQHISPGGACRVAPPPCCCWRLRPAPPLCRTVLTTSAAPSPKTCSRLLSALAGVCGHLGWLLYSLMAAVAVACFCPVAAGSGLPQMRVGVGGSRLGDVHRSQRGHCYTQKCAAGLP